MVEVVVTSVLNKLADHAISVFKQIDGVGEQVEKVKRELIRIQAFLKDADRKTIRDETQKNWVREVREVAYDIEDLVDTLLLDVVPVPQKATSKRKSFLRMFKKPQKLPAIHKLGDQINKILEKIEEISSSRIKYDIKDLVEGNEGDFRLPRKPVILPGIDDPNIVGFDTHTTEIVKLLLEENTQRRSVVSIIGIGGLGKTTLARKVYNSDDVKANFSLRIWVTVSQKFDLADLLRKILKQINPDFSGEQGSDIEYFLTQLYEYLKGNKYLLVLDDVWAEELWSHIEEVLIDANNGSRVLITSRNENVAKCADPSRQPYKLSVLPEEQALQLLLKKAHYDANSRNNADSRDLIEIAKQLTKKCGGLPLALTVLGGQLSKKPPEYSAWGKLLQTMSWHTDGSRCTEILASSYDDLPLVLKFCFMYFAAFPEDYQVEVDELVRLWIAEGFILQEETRTLEDTAERFLEELAQRSMVEISEGDDGYGGSIKYCHVHDLLRDLAIEKVKEDNFMIVCSKPDEEHRWVGARRVAVHHSKSDGLISYASSNLRTLLCFNPSQLPNCSGHKLLKVLRGTTDWRNNISMAGDEKIEVLTQLRYLRLDWIVIGGKEEQLSKCINGMKFLQTLAISSRDKCDLSGFTWEIETLRHVMLRNSLGPPPGANLRNLITLTKIKIRESWEITRLPNMPNLCSLEVEITEGCAWEVVVAFLCTLKSLVNLTFCGDPRIPIEVWDMRKFPFYQQLNHLHYRCMLDIRKGVDVLDAVMLPTHLTVLNFRTTSIRQDVMLVLEKLPSLVDLIFYASAIKNVKQMRCSAEGFPRLQFLKITCMESKVEEWEIEEGAMPILKKLEVYMFSMARVPLGLTHLTKLCKLKWVFSFDDQYATNQAEEIRNLCGHVPQVKIDI